MVLETLLPSSVAREKPHYMMLVAFLFAIVGMWLAYFIFPFSASILTLAFIVIAAEPIIRRTLMQEEDEEAQSPGNPGTFLERHFDLIKIYSWFFLGLILAYMTWYIILPGTEPLRCVIGNICGEFPTRDSVFAEQERQLLGIAQLRDSAGTGNVVSISGMNVGGSQSGPAGGGDFWGIAQFLFANNATVLLLAILFSFLFGEGALFLISWNASIIGTVIGKIAAQSLAMAPVHDIFSIVFAMAYGIYHGIGFIPHGIPEIVAYYIGAIAGGIISASMSKQVYRTNEFQTIAKDAAALIGIAVVLLWGAAMIESYLWLFT
ncbi:MAG: stage II sporulation protein M [Candidatus Diapherotrites archaeon]